MAQRPTLAVQVWALCEVWAAISPISRITICGGTLAWHHGRDNTGAQKGGRARARARASRYCVGIGAPRFNRHTGESEATPDTDSRIMALGGLLHIGGDPTMCYTRRVATSAVPEALTQFSSEESHLVMLRTEVEGIVFVAVCARRQLSLHLAHHCEVVWVSRH